MVGPFLIFYFFALWCGFLLPIPSLILAWREWVRVRKTPVLEARRRLISLIGLLLLSLGLALWVYAIVREACLHDYSYVGLSAGVGRWGSFGLIIFSAFAEGKIRRYLLLGAVGLLFFFGASIGDVAI